MTRPDIPRRVLDAYAAKLRSMADDAGEVAARAEVDGRTGDAQRWEGRKAGLTEAHDLITAVLTAANQGGATTFRLDARVTVTTGNTTVDGTVADAWPVGGELVYLIQPDESGRDTFTARAEQMRAADNAEGGA
jgi:hypothetical protein